jgi:serine/threonine protein kinase
MTPTPGTRLGPYEILGRLGAGGMGEVYRARDNRLGREVALKVLPPELANDTARRARFEQEARAAAALNHANIMAVYDIGSEGGVGYMVTELVSGETLEAILERGPLPTRKLLDIAVQTADGMACAHAARITHRDLKPANIMITGPESGQPGRVKILDFGLAKQAAPVAVADETVAMHSTEPGMILGTVNYMSPEQARGKPADHRSDQFSFGIILYEMATGKKPFQKPETVQTLSAILTEDPPPIEANIPAPLRWTIERCLAKDPAERYDSTRDLYQGLRNLRDHLSETTSTQRALPEVSAPSPRRRARWPIPLALVAGLLAALSTVRLLRGPQTPDQSMYRFTPFSFDPGGNINPVWAPDGKSVAYAARQNSGPYQVFLRDLDSPSSVQITHTMENIYPSRWTPDGQRILMNSDRKPDSLWSVAKVGGEPEVVMKLPEGLITGDVAPDYKSAAILLRGKDGQVGVWISSPLDSEPKPYAPAPFTDNVAYNEPRLKFSPDGKSILLLINRRREEAWLLPYPPNSSKPSQVLRGLDSSGTPEFSWMPDSRHIVLALLTGRSENPQLWMADVRSAERFALTSGTTSHSTPAVSPDGRRLIFGQTTGHYDIISVDLSTAEAQGMMSTERNQYMPAWAAKQPLLAFVTNRNGPDEIWLHSPSGPDRPLVMPSDFPADPTQRFMAPALSPDGDRVIYARVERNVGAVHLWMSSVASRAVVRLTNDSAVELPGSWSPDGSWFGYFRLLNGKADVMKVKTTGQATPMLLQANATDGGVVSWSPTGEWIAYGDGHLISPDGANKRSIGDHHSAYYMFSNDGKVLYGVRTDQDRELLFSVDIATGAEKILGDLGREFRPGNNLNPSIRFSMAPDGKSFVYSAGNFKRNLWMLEGFAPERSFWSRLLP